MAANSVSLQDRMLHATIIIFDEVDEVSAELLNISNGGFVDAGSDNLLGATTDGMLRSSTGRGPDQRSRNSSSSGDSSCGRMPGLCVDVDDSDGGSSSGAGTDGYNASNGVAAARELPARSRTLQAPARRFFGVMPVRSSRRAVATAAVQPAQHQGTHIGREVQVTPGRSSDTLAMTTRGMFRRLRGQVQLLIMGPGSAQTPPVSRR